MRTRDESFACSKCGSRLGAGATVCPQCSAEDSAARANPEWIVGSDADATIVVDSPEVSRRHCKLTRTPNGFVLEDLGSTNGTFVNGVRITSPTPVQPSDRITLGKKEPLPWPPASSSTSAPDVSWHAAKGLTARAIRIGRDPDNDVVLDYPMVSAHHAAIAFEGGTAYLVDLGSTNGTAIGKPDRKVTRAPVTETDVVYFGSLRVTAARLFGKDEGATGRAVRVAFAGDELTIGRDARNEVVLDYPMISARHARLYRSGGTVYVEDLGSTNGTYVNGVRIARAIAVRPGDTIALGSYAFVLTSSGDLEKRDYRGNVTLESVNVAFAAGGRKLLDDISLTIYPSEFVGLMGPSGAGKTTLMLALNGYTPPTSGRVLVNGEDLYENYDQFCGHVGYVPQNDIMHGELTVRQALYYTARLRLPSDYGETDIAARVASVLEQLGLDAVGDVLIGSPEKKGISGGQRKRVNLAMELLTDPSVLFLDEPTSGLSSEDTLMVMRLLRGLADEGKTILLTIHQPSLEAYRLMDNLVMVAKDKGSAEPGSLVYYGPAYPDAVDFFNPNGVEGLEPGREPSPDEVLRGLAREPAAMWARRYGSSRFKREYVEDRKGKRPAESAKAVEPKIKRGFGIAQWTTLVRRCLAIKARDRVNTAILLVQAPIIALLIVLVFGSKVTGEIQAGSPPERWLEFSSATATSIFLMAISAIWFGCSNAAREIVGEWAIYHRERMVNLKIPSYVLSKLAVLGGLCLLQCAVLLGIVYWGCELKGDFAAMYAALVLASLVGVGFGLTVSAFSKTSEAAIALVPLILIPMVIVGGMMIPIHKMNSGMRTVAEGMASRWAFEAMLVDEAKERLTWTGPQPPAGSNVTPHDVEDLAETYFPANDKRVGAPKSMAVLAVMLLVLVAAIMGILKRRDVH